MSSGGIFPYSRHEIEPAPKRRLSWSCKILGIAIFLVIVGGSVGVALAARHMHAEAYGNGPPEIDGNNTISSDLN